LLRAQLADWTTEELTTLSAMMERLDADLRSREKQPKSARRDSKGDLTKV
jgi:hypothetical protein